MPAPRPTFFRHSDRKPDVFLSHSSVDKPTVRRLAKDLSSVGADVWFDDWEIEIGDSLHQSIGRGLRCSRYVAVVLSQKSTASRWCAEELETAFVLEREDGRKRILPLLFDSTEVPVFLKGRVYQDMRGENYFQGITLVAGIIHGFTKQALSEAIAQKNPTNMDGVGEILSALGWKGRFYLEPSVFERHKQQILNYCGARLEDMYLDEEYFQLIERMQRDGETIFPLKWPLE
jgi:TIR domain